MKSIWYLPIRKFYLFYPEHGKNFEIFVQEIQFLTTRRNYLFPLEQKDPIHPWKRDFLYKEPKAFEKRRLSKTHCLGCFCCYPECRILVERSLILSASDQGMTSGSGHLGIRRSPAQTGQKTTIVFYWPERETWKSQWKLIYSPHQISSLMKNHLHCNFSKNANFSQFNKLQCLAISTYPKYILN